MGSSVEINDTLQITSEQGFPGDIFSLERHLNHPITIEEVSGMSFNFHSKPGPRLFQLAPVRVYFVHNINGKWLFWGKIQIIGQNIAQHRVDGQPWKEGVG